MLSFTCLFSCKKKDKPQQAVEIPTMEKDCMQGYAFVYVRGQVDPRMVSSAYQKYGVNLQAIVDEEKNTAIYSFDSKKIKPDSMLRVLHYSQFASKARCLKQTESKYLLRP